MKKYILLLISVIMSVSISAQKFTQKGVVVDNIGEPYVGVSIVEKGTTNGVITDVDGRFSITVDSVAVLVFKYVGCETQEYKVDRSKPFVKIIIEDSKAILDEVVVTGYGTMSEKSITGAVSSLAGRAAGVSSGKSSGVRVKGKVAKPAAILDNNKVGLLTAGELNDFSKWMMWDSITTKVLNAHVDTWRMKAQERYIAQLTNHQGMPIVNATVILADDKNSTIWETKTDNTGRAELWSNLFQSSQKDRAASIYIEHNGKDTTIVAKPFSEGINIASLDVDCNKTKNVDIMMIVDATGSMGDEIIYLKNELHDIINKIQNNQKDLDIRIGSVFYRDRGDAYLTRKSELDKDIVKTINFIQEQEAGGGGDYPEAVDEALYQAIEMESWHEDALARVAFLVLDAPAHSNEKSVQQIHKQIRLAAEKGIRIIPIVCSGIDKSGEYLMRNMALATNGTYVFLTDDSGIGDSHIKPSTDKWDVETLNNLMVRLITQYTQMPDCENSSWEKDYGKTQDNDKFIPNPYDENREGNVSKLSSKDVMKVYPSPCSSILKIDIKKNGVKDVFLVDVSGKSLLRLNSSTKETIEVDVTPYSAGVYFIKAYYKGRWFTEKIIIL